MAHNLLDLPDADSFRDEALRLLNNFPKVAPWFKWWLHDSHASMLFVARRKMDTDLWNSLPESTNAEEAMHWKLYWGVGRDHSFFSRLEALMGFAAHYECLLLGVAGACVPIVPSLPCCTQTKTLSVGAPVRYGKAEPWKLTAARIGRMKPSRAPYSSPATTVQTTQRRRKKNDRRPPDTCSALTSKRKKKESFFNSINNHLELMKSTEISARQAGTAAIQPLGLTSDPGSESDIDSESERSKEPRYPAKSTLLPTVSLDIQDVEPTRNQPTPHLPGGPRIDLPPALDEHAKTQSKYY